MTGGNGLIDQIKVVLTNRDSGHCIDLWIDVWDNSLARAWLQALDQVLTQALPLQKNYCFLGFAESPRDGEFLCAEINRSIQCINDAGLGYVIQDRFHMQDCMAADLQIQHERLNCLHRYFEDLQGISGDISKHWLAADPVTRWHISQLNLLCHEFEAWALSWLKLHTLPEWQRPSQLMCWNRAPRFRLEPKHYELFGIHTIARPMGAVYVGVNKAVGKHHWEVFQDEGRDSRIGELTTSTLRSQTEAAADFDIEWGQDPGRHPFMHQQLADFRTWLVANGFDPDDPALTIGHPQIGQVDLARSFGTGDAFEIWSVLAQHLDVAEVSTSNCSQSYHYHWTDQDYITRMTGETS